MRTRINLSRKQRELYDYLSNFVAENGYAPTYQQMADGLGLKSRSSIFRRIKEMQMRGWIEVVPRKMSAITLLPVDGENHLRHNSDSVHSCT